MTVLHIHRQTRYGSSPADDARALEPIHLPKAPLVLIAGASALLLAIGCAVIDREVSRDLRGAAPSIATAASD